MLQESHRIINGSSLLIATFALAILLFLDRSTSRYRIYWIISTITVTIASLSLWFYVDGIQFYSELQSGYTIPPDELLVLTGPINSLLVSNLRAAFPILVLLGWFPPKSFRWPLRCLSALGTTVCGITLSVIIAEKSEAYIADYHTRVREIRQEKREKQAQKNNPDREWGLRRPPDPEEGPQTEGEWRWLGFQTYWEAPRSKSGMQLRSLQLNGPSKDEKRTLLALQMLKYATGLNKLRFDGMLNDAEIKYILPLNSLKRLELNRSQITDSGLAQLQSLDELQALDISITPITDRSLDVFPNFKSLTYVRLFRTEITHDGMKLFGLKHGRDWKTSGLLLKKRSKEDAESRRNAVDEIMTKLKSTNPEQYQESLESRKRQIEELERKVGGEIRNSTQRD